MNKSTSLNNPEGAKAYFASKLAYTIGPADLDEKIDQGHADFTIIDVRSPSDYADGHIFGAVNLPEDRWDSLEGLDKSKTNVLYCYSAVCHLAARAALRFASKGYPVVELEGGYPAWSEHAYRVEKGAGSQRKSA